MRMSELVLQVYQTSAEIEAHEKDVAYVEIEALRHCIKLLDSRNVVVLTGREGSGKSRNGLEILRQFKERHKDSDVFKLIGLHYVSDIVKCNVTNIVLFDDAFGKTSKHFSYDEQVLNHLYSYTSQNKVKVIFTMRNYVRHACHRLLSTHKIFREFVDIDLNSEKFQLTAKEKEEMLTNYCAINKIWIFEEKTNKDNTTQSMANGAEREDNEGRRSLLDQAGVILKRTIMNEIIETDPLVGFPECCRLFTTKSNRTHLDSSCFKWPSTVLINDIEKLRIEGIDNHMNGLKYVTFVYILTQGKGYNSKDIRGLARKDINVETFKKLHKVFYNKNHTVHTSDIEYVCNKSIDLHLVSKDGTFWFQHKAIQDSVLISCSKICPSVIIPLLSFNHMIDMVRPHNYTEQKDETVIKISKPYYYELAKKIISLLNVDPQFFEKEDLIKIAIDRFILFEMEDDFDNSMGYGKIVEILLQKPVIKCWNKNTLIDVANRGRWYNVLELLFIQDIDKSINKEKIVEDIYEDWSNENFQYEENVYEFAHFTKTVQLIMKYYSDHIVINKILKIAVEFGIHNCFEELLLDKVDNISYYLNITLDKLQSEQLYQGFISFDEGHGKILLLLLQRINSKCMNLNRVMNELCHIGHSSAVLLLLEKSPYHRFNMKNVMNKACYHGDIKLVDYLFRKYSADDCDFKTAMNEACRNKAGDVCKWLWANIKRSMFDMQAALNNASKYGSTENVKWILTDVDTELYDIEAAVVYASEHGTTYTLQLLLKQSDLHMLNSQSALTRSCRNCRSCLDSAKLLYRRANVSNLDMNAILSEACKYFRTDFIQWIIETCNKNITVFKTNDGHKHFIKSLDKHCVDVDQAVTCILDMKDPAQKKDHLNKTKNQLLMVILEQSDPSIIYIYTLLAETCKNDWVEIFQWILEKVDHAHLNIGEIINVACRFGAFNIIKWSLENIDMQLVDVDNVMVESCGFGWIDCLVLLLKHCNQYKLQEAMTEACSYGRLHIAEWLLQNVHSQFFNIPMLLQEAGRNGWINIFGWILQKFHLYKSDMHIATSQALENGHLEIAELVISTVGKDCFSFSSLSENTYMGANKEGVVNFLLHNTDHRDIDIAKIMTKACLFGWKDTASFILDNGLTSLCDLSLAFNTACDNGELEIAELLLHQVDPHILTTVDKAMHSVAVKGWDEIALLLIDNVEHTRLDIGNAFIEACRHGEIDGPRTQLIRSAFLLEHK
ncbi:uncharacterized protein [Mytilus edulis]|uniref:uncharacterized protein n=1 Tax=Mytilus edulis TaxID=6550 RepID=UPI0039F0C00F